MKLVTFDPYRALGLPGAVYIKPEHALSRLAELRSADWLLFPEYWQINTLNYGLKRRIFPSVASYHLGHDKIEMTRVLQAVASAHVPETLILPATDTAVEQALDTLSLPLVAKVPRSSMGQGVALIESAGALRAWAAEQPVLYLQERLPIDRDLRVVLVGEKAVTAYRREAAPGVFHNNVARGGEIRFDPVPEAALRLVERIAGELGVDHAGFDLAEVDGHFYVLEFNVLFGNDGLVRRGVSLAGPILEYLRDRWTPPESPSTEDPFRLAG